MASIVKRGKKYVVVYYYTDEKGVRRQKWEPAFATKQKAQKRLNEIQYQMDTGTFIPPSCITVSEFLDEFVELYGTKKWGLSIYGSNTGLIRNYIVPLIGDCLVQDVDARVVDQFIHNLQKTKAVEVGGRKPHSEYVTPCTIHKIFKLMNTAFKQAVRWGMVGRNPFEGAILPKHEKKKRAIWDAATIRKALDACEDGKLYIAINLAFACSLRLGEICGLTWDCLHITDDAIVNDNAYVLVEKELARVSKESVRVLGQQDILFAFPATMAGLSTTQLVLKKPKTESSIRKVWIPKTLARILQQWKAEQDKLKAVLGDDYLDYGLVIALENGRPCEERVIGNAFNRLKAKAGLPDVVFHSLRHSSTTYKLKLNHGDIKATQGDTGHAQPDMVTEVYSHILDEDRKINAQRFEAGFYANPDMRGVEKSIREKSNNQVDLAALVKQIQENPELAEILKNLISGDTK